MRHFKVCLYKTRPQPLLGGVGLNKGLFIQHATAALRRSRRNGLNKTN